jgi:hypothetical protein
MAVRRLLAPFLAAALIAGALGCSDSDPEAAPAACVQGPGAYLEALGDAPERVELAGEAPISDCLAPSQEGGELAEVGSAMIAAATRLNAGARRDPTGEQAFRLGYLIGAAQRGADDTAGIHTDLIRRLNAAARFDPSGTPPAAFERTFGRGFQAGRESG